MVKDICADAGIEGQKTNRSLQVRGATELFHAGVPEKVIQGRTGHLSLSGLRQYERTNSDEQLAVSKVLSSRKILCTSSSFFAQSNLQNLINN